MEIDIIGIDILEVVSGHLATLLAASFAALRLRPCAWAGDCGPELVSTELAPPAATRALQVVPSVPYTMAHAVNRGLKSRDQSRDLWRCLAL